MSDSKENVVELAQNGPLCLSGDLLVEGQDPCAETALCRCGLSKNKPFCDGSHNAAGFADPGACGDAGEGPDPATGRLEVKQAKNGPLLLSGNFAIVTGDGQVAWRGTKAALCRCGASKNKPFCDGSHKPAGFSAE